MEKGKKMFLIMLSYSEHQSLLINSWKDTRLQ